MATVNDLIGLLDDRLLSFSNSFPAPHANAKIRALDAGKDYVWRALVAAGREQAANWFATSASVAFGSGAKAANLPEGFHDALFVEAAGVICRPSGWHKQNWRDQRAESAAFANAAAVDELLWIVAGQNPGSLLLGRGVTGGITVTLHYTARLASWTSTSDNVDAVPLPYQSLVVTYAAATLTAAHHHAGVATGWREMLAAETQAAFPAMGVRQSGGAVTVEDYDSVA